MRWARTGATPHSHLSVSDGERTILTWAIRYQDRWRRLDGRWLFVHRLLVLDWTDTRAAQDCDSVGP